MEKFLIWLHCGGKSHAYVPWYQCMDWIPGLNRKPAEHEHSLLSASSGYTHIVVSPLTPASRLLLP